jgi:uncharacterized protein
MSTRHTPWPAGAPCWTDLMVTDIERTKAFYSKLLGWTYDETGPEYGGYANAQRDGEVVAGLSPAIPGRDLPHAWAVYLASDDVVATSSAVEAAGGHGLAPVMDVGPFGRMASFVDPNGAMFGVWEARTHIGWTRRDEPGAVAWTDIVTPDAATARTFYTTAFGLQFSDEIVMGAPYSMFGVAGLEGTVGGVMGNPDTPASAWNVCFAVGDVDASASTITGAGGSIVAAPYDFDYGRMLSATGPDGEPFQLIAMKA